MLFWVELVLVLYGASLGVELRHEIVIITQIGTVGLHVVAFGMMALTAFLIWHRTFLTVIALVLLAVVIEAAQLVIRGRTGSILDGLASSAGIVLGWACWLLYQRLLPSAGDPNVNGGRSGQSSAITSTSDVE